MKKLLSVVLALAIVIGCLSIVSFANTAWAPNDQTVTGVKIKADVANQTNKVYRASNAGLTADMITEETVGGVTQRYILLQYRVYNLNNVGVTVSIKAENGWNALSTSALSYPGHPDETSGKQTIPAYGSHILSIKIHVNNENKVEKADGTFVALSTLSLRFDFSTNFAANQEFVIRALNEDSANFCVNAGDTCYIFSAKERIKGTAYYETLNLAKGVKLTATATSTGDGSDQTGFVVFGTKDANTDGYIFEDCPDFTGELTVSYTVYNDSDHDLNATIRFSRRGKWDYVAGKNLSTSDIVIPAKTKAVVSNAIAVENGKATIEGEQIDASQIHVRMNINYKKLTQGDVFYVEPMHSNDPMFYGNSSINGLKRENITELPNLQMMATPTPETTPVATPVTTPVTSPETPVEPTQAPVGIKYSVKEDKATGAVSVNDYGNSPWASDASFTGQKKLNYVVYNTSSKEVKVTLYITMLSGGTTKNGDAETIGTVTLPAGYKGDLSAYVNVEDGTVKMKADDSLNGSLNTIRLRFTLEFTGGAKVGDSVIIAPADGNSKDFIITKFSAGGVDKEVVYQLPDDALTLATPKTPIGIQFIAKEDKATGAIGVNDYNNSPWEADPSFTGQKKLDYIVYNTSNKTVTVEFFITVLLDLTDDGTNNPTTHSGDAETHTKITLPAGYKGDLSALVNVENGIAKLKADGSLNGALNLIRLRFTLNFDGGATKDKDSVIIVPSNGDIEDFVMTKFVAGGVNKELAYEFPPEPQKPVGIVLTVPEDKKVDYFITSEGVFDADPTFTGKKEITYTIYNKTSKMLVVTPSLQIKDSGWWGPSSDTVSIAIGQKAEVKASIDVVNGKVTIKEKEYDLAKVFLRFNFKDADLKKDDKIYIKANEELDIIYSTPITTSGMTLAPVYELPAVEAPKIPTGLKVTVLKDLDTASAYFSTGAGIVKAEDVKNGEIIKTYQIKNSNDFDIMFKVDLVATVTTSDGSSWKSVAGADSEYITIPAGEIAEIKYVCDTKDGKVELTDDSEVEISKLLAKFSVKTEDGTVPEGAKFTLYFAEAEVANFASFENSESTKFSYEIIYTAAGADTGDVLPVALIATVAFAAIALVVASKKRKED